MNGQKYTATLSRGGRDRAGLCVIFRHPVRLGSDGKPGLRIRRGLGTSEKHEAQKLVDQLNRILEDRSFWTAASKENAERAFDARVVNAFYDGLVPMAHDGWALRDKIIPLPSAVDGYARVQMIGTTGAGKTSLVRQFIGTGGENEKFPSISAAKTTTCDIEIVLKAAERFEAVVSFLTQDQVRQYIEECISSAVLTRLTEGNEEVVARRFLEHSEQRFRLSYLLGALREDTEDGETDREGAWHSPGMPPRSEDGVSPEEQQRLAEKLRAYVDRVYEIAELSQREMERRLDFSWKNASQDDRDTFEELLEDYLRSQDRFYELVDAILDDVESRFDRLRVGSLKRGADEWPTEWTCSLPRDERLQFIRLVNYFTSNQATLFGRLLTPLVEGIRVSGPFTPSWDSSSVPRLALMDGEGLGHAANTLTSVSTRITKRYQLADAIVLVDSAVQPMLAAPGAALRSIVSSGQQSKLVIAFTHLDQVVGDNLPSDRSKERHVLSSLDNLISGLGSELGRGAESALRKISGERTFFLQNLQQPASPTSADQAGQDTRGAPVGSSTEHAERATRKALVKLLDVIRSVSQPPVPENISPIYDDAELSICIQQAVQGFREPWRAKLGRVNHAGIDPEHWSRIKALTRRLGLLGQDEYGNLRPVADLIARLQERIRPFLAAPLRWEPQGGTDEMMTQKIDTAAAQVSTALHAWASDRLVQKRAVEWQLAYAHRGPGSTIDRSRDVEAIYEAAAPIPGVAAGALGHEFLLQVRLLTREAIMTAGGKLVGINDVAATVGSFA